MSSLGLLFENSFSCRTPSLENLLSNNLKEKTEYYGIWLTRFIIYLGRSLGIATQDYQRYSKVEFSIRAALRSSPPLSVTELSLSLEWIQDTKH